MRYTIVMLLALGCAGESEPGLHVCEGTTVNAPLTIPERDKMAYIHLEWPGVPVSGFMASEGEYGQGEWPGPEPMHYLSVTREYPFSGIVSIDVTRDGKAYPPQRVAVTTSEGTKFYTCDMLAE